MSVKLKLPSEIIVAYKEKLSKLPKQNLLMMYGTTDLNICGIIMYLDENFQKEIKCQSN